MRRILARDPNPRALAPTAEADDGAIYRHPQTTRQILDWTPSTVQGAIAAADTGRLQVAADLCRALMRDSRISGVMRTRTLGQLALPRRFEGAAVRPRVYLEDHWAKALPDTEVAKLLAWGLVLGVGVGSLQWHDSPEGCFPYLHVWDPRYLWLDYTDPDCPQWRIQAVDGAHIPVNPGDGTWVLYTPYGAWEPWREGLWQSIATPWLLKQFALYDRARHSEVNGSPSVIGKSRGLSERQRRRFLTDLRAMARNARMVLPEGCDVELLEATGRTWEIYEASISWADSENTIAIAGQSVTTEGTTGFSEGQIHKRILGELITATGNTLAATLNDQVVAPWMRYQFGNDVKLPSVRYRTEPPEDLAKSATALQSLGQAVSTIDASLSRHGLKLDVRKLLDRYEIPVRRLVVADADGQSIEVDDSQAPAIPVQLAPTDIATVLRVDEARGLMGLPAIGDQGELTITAFKAANSRQVAEAAEAAKGDPDAAE